MKNLFTKLSVCLLMASSLFLTSCSTNSDEVLTVGEKKATLEGSTAKALPDLYEYRKYVFVRPKGAAGNGHVGVGFELRARISGRTYLTYYCGAVEGTNGWFGIPNAYIAPGTVNGGWNTSNSTQQLMFSEFRGQRNYTFYKSTQYAVTTLAASNLAKNFLINFQYRGYAVASNNCMNACFDVLNALGGSNANPSVPTQYRPNDWYNSLTASRGWSATSSL